MTLVQPSTTEDEISTALVKLLEATATAQIEDVIQSLEKFGFEWRLVGDRNNYATIHVASFPGAALIERVTNAIDAALEVEAEKSPKLTEECHSPRIFVEKAFGVKEGYLTTLESKIDREKLVEKAGLVITLRDSDSKSTPTIDIQDRGIGISRTEFPDTILSLNRDNKIKKWYLMGRFGQGGSATLRFSKYTLIISRRQYPDGRQDKEVSFTIVRLKDAEKDEKDGQYVYLVRKSDRLPFSVKADVDTYPSGTLVRHVDYEIGKKTAPLMLDIYSLLESRLFDPVLPFWLSEQRSWVEHKNDRRRTFGSRDRLQKSELIECLDEQIAAVGPHGELGTVTVRYWVFKQGTEAKVKQTFVNPDEPILVTYLGQTHATLPKRILATDCQLPNLYRDIVVQIECDSLNDLGRRKIFSSTREVITEEGLAQFKSILAEILQQELADLDEEREVSILKGGAVRAKESLRRKLAEMINRIKPGTFDLTGGKGKGVNIRTRTKHRKQYSPLPVKDFPTFVRIGNTNIPIRFGAGRTTWIGLESDAPDNFLAKFKGEILLDKDGPKYCKVTSHHTDFKGGRLSVGTTLSGDHPINTQFKFGLKVSSVKGDKTVTFDDWEHAIIVPPYQGGGDKKVPLEVPDIVEVSSTSEFWKSNGWTENNVAEVREKEGHVTIYISTENKWLIGMVMNSSYYISTKEKLKTKYILHMALYSYLQFDGMLKLTKGADGGDSAGMPKLDEETREVIIQHSLEWGARAVLTAITSEQGFEKGEEDIEAV